MQKVKIIQVNGSRNGFVIVDGEDCVRVKKKTRVKGMKKSCHNRPITEKEKKILEWPCAIVWYQFENIGTACANSGSECMKRDDDDEWIDSLFFCFFGHSSYFFSSFLLSVLFGVCTVRSAAANRNTITHTHTKSSATRHKRALCIESKRIEEGKTRTKINISKEKREIRLSTDEK